MASKRRRSRSSRSSRRSSRGPHRPSSGRRSFRDAIDQARQHAEMHARITTGDPNVAIVRAFDGSFHLYSADAWKRPKERSILPWSPPPFPKNGIIATVRPDGSFLKGPNFKVRKATGKAW